RRIPSDAESVDPANSASVTKFYNYVLAPASGKKESSAQLCFRKSSARWRRTVQKLQLTLTLVALVLAIGNVAALAQSTAQINGAVRDQTGAVLPGVEVAATQTATGAKRTAITNETGDYVLASLPLGPYV